MPKEKASILIIDDNKDILESLSLFLSRKYQRVETLSSPKLLHRKLEENSLDLVLLDMNFSRGQHSGNEGLFWLQEILKWNSKQNIILITAYGEVNLAVEGMKLGAFDFILKPWEKEKLLASISAAVKLSRSQQESLKLKEEKKALEEKFLPKTEFFWGASRPMQQLKNDLEKIAQSDASVYISGESGTGKDSLAELIHQKSKRSNHEFVAIDTGAIHENLFESELFGYVKGAFTDAKNDKTGKIQLANEGTLFLNEITNINLNTQANLLTVLQSKSYTPIGSNELTNVDFRLITASHKHIESQIQEKNFREDLWYRINTICIELPALRHRKEDIEGLAKLFLDEYSKKYGKQNLQITEPGLKSLQDYDWPGNIRELRHCIEKAVILSETKELGKKDFQVQKSSQAQISGDDLNLENLERNAIIQAMKLHAGNMTKIASSLGITRPTLYAKMKKYEI